MSFQGGVASQMNS